MRKLLLWIAALLIALSTFAQNTELHIGVGGFFPVNNPSADTSAFVVQGTFAQRVFSVPMVGLYVEVPVAKTLDVNLTFGRASYSALFVTPGFKLKIAPGFPASPYLAGGIGMARFTQSAPGIAENSDSRFAADFAGGVDMKIAPFLSLRGEFRDFFTGRPALTLPFPGTGRQHNLVTTGGLVIRF